MKKIVFFTVAIVLAVSSYSFSANFQISTDEIFAPGDPNNPVTVSVSSRDIPVLDMRLYEISNPEAYFLGLKDIHSPTVKTKRDISGTSEMIGGVKRKTKRLIRQDYRSLLTVKMRKDVVSALGLPHAAEAKTKKPETFELYPVLKEYRFVKRWNEDLTIKKPGRWEYHNIAIDVKKPGCYLVEAVYQDNVAYTAVIVTTLAFVVKNSPTDDLVYVADRVTGKPVANANISIWGNDKKKLTSGRTNSDGLFYTKTKKEEIEGIYVFASKGDSFTIADPYTYFYWYESKDKVYTYTDRPVYRPGHTVYFRSIIREGKTKGLVVPAKDEQYLVTIKDSKGNEIYRKSHGINEFGSLSGELVLGAEPPLGEYDIVVEYEGEHFYGHFKVEEYKKPEFEVKVNTDKPVYISGETINADIEAKYYFGSPVAGGEVEYVVYRAVYKRPWWWGYDWAWYYMDSDYYWGTKREMVDSMKGKLDENGKLSVSLDTSRYVKKKNKDYTFTVEAKVTDLSRREIKGIASVKVSRASFAMIVRTDRWVYSPNDEAKITVKALDFQNKGVANVKVNLIVTEKKRREKTVTSTEILNAVTNSNGEAIFTYRVKDTGRISFAASAFDLYGNSTSSLDTVYSYTWGKRYGGEETAGGITIVPDKNSYTKGDVAHVLILTPTDSSHVLVTTEARSIIDSKVIKIEGGSAIFDIPIEDEHTPNIFLTASMIFNNEIYTKTKKVIIPATHKFMNVEITSDKETYEPQEEGTFSITTTDHKGKPVSAEVSLGLVDAAIYAIAPDSVVNIEKYFYKLRPHVVETTSSLYFRFYGYSHRRGLLSALDKKETTLADFKGDTGMVEPEIRKDFKDTMYWSPAIKTGLNGKATVTMKFPDNLTRWRATSRGITADTVVGEGRHRVISRKDMIVRIEAPRFFRQGDEMLVSTIAHNYLSEDKNVRFTFDAKGLKLFGGGPQEYVVPKNSERRIDWKIKANDVGNAVLTAKAMTNEVSDGMELTIPVLPKGLKIRENRMGEILKDPGRVKITLERPPDTVKNSSELVIDISPTLVNTMVAAIPYLVGYPYG